MSEPATARSLVVLVADKDMEQALLGLLERPESLGIRPVARYDIFVHPGRDSGCRTHCDGFLRNLQRRYAFALVLFDLEGSGRDSTPRVDVETEVERRLEANGWKGRSASIALDPELEVWVWSDSSEVDLVLGWSGASEPKLREWVRDQGFVLDDSGKPARPKEALRAALRQVRKQPSSALFRALARRVSLNRCTDPGLAKLTRVLRGWFPPGNAS